MMMMAAPASSARFSSYGVIDHGSENLQHCQWAVEARMALAIRTRDSGR
jgi:hypothetical protein